MRILVFGDVVGKPGRLALRERLPSLRVAHAADVVVVNGENASGGIGLTVESMRELFACGVDILTSGNHIWKHREIYATLDREPRLLRPANYPDGSPGRGVCVHELSDGRRVAVLNLLGRTYMDALECPFRTADMLLASVPEDVTVRIVDFHAEATSEKKALGWHLDGRVSAVLGTHTHVQTADAMLLPGGTAYLTDLGMCGVEASVLGMDHKVIVDRFLTAMPQRFRPASGRGSLNGVFLEVDDATGQALRMKCLREGCPTAVREVWRGEAEMPPEMPAERPDDESGQRP